eukprot:403335644
MLVNQLRNFSFVGRRTFLYRSVSQYQGGSSGGSGPNFSNKDKKTDQDSSSQNWDFPNRQSEKGDTSSQGTSKQQDSNFGGFMKDAEKHSYKNFSNKMTDLDAERLANKELSNDMDLISDKMPPPEFMTDRAEAMDDFKLKGDSGFFWKTKK